MRIRSIGLALALCVIPAAAAAAGKAPATAPQRPKAVARDGWPATREGDVSRRWVAAFDAGEDSLRVFYEREMDPDSLSRRSARERARSARRLRERFGKLVLASVLSADSAKVRVQLMDSEAALHDFTFTFQSSAPRRLVSISMLETRPGGHGGFHH